MRYFISVFLTFFLGIVLCASAQVRDAEQFWLPIKPDVTFYHKKGDTPSEQRLKDLIRLSHEGKIGGLEVIYFDPTNPPKSYRERTGLMTWKSYFIPIYRFDEKTGKLIYTGKTTGRFDDYKIKKFPALSINMYRNSTPKRGNLVSVGPIGGKNLDEWITDQSNSDEWSVSEDGKWRLPGNKKGQQQEEKPYPRLKENSLPSPSQSKSPAENQKPAN